MAAMQQIWWCITEILEFPFGAPNKFDSTYTRRFFSTGSALRCFNPALRQKTVAGRWKLLDNPKGPGNHGPAQFRFGIGLRPGLPDSEKPQANEKNTEHTWSVCLWDRGKGVFQNWFSES